MSSQDTFGTLLTVLTLRGLADEYVSRLRVAYYDEPVDTLRQAITLAAAKDVVLEAMNATAAAVRLEDE